MRITPHTTIPRILCEISARPAPFVMTSRSAVEKYVSGKNFAKACNHHGIFEIAKKVPPRKSIGNTTRLAIAGTASVVVARPEIVKPKPRNIVAPSITQRKRSA